MIKVNIKCFSQVQYALGQTDLLVELEDGSKSSDLEKIIRIKAKGKLVGVSLRVAINQNYVKGGWAAKELLYHKSGGGRVHHP